MSHDPAAATATQGESGLADLHRHLDGSLRLSTLEELAGPCGISVPEGLGFFPGMGLEAALRCFELTLSVLRTRAAVERVAREICEDAEAEGVTTLEIRFAPQLHLGAEPEAITDAALAGCDGRAGLILCGLYGEPPEVLEQLVEIARTRAGVVGIDLAGGPASGHEWRMSDYQKAFERAAELGIGRTVHAGEGRPAEEIRAAIEHLRVQRVGHATTLLDDQSLLELVLERDVVIEACVTSNLQTGAIATLQEHPLPRWLALGVRASINTDNTLFSHIDAPIEHQRVAALPGMTPDLLERAIAIGHAEAFSR